MGDGVEESGDSGRFAAEPRRPEDVEEVKRVEWAMSHASRRER